LNRTSFFHHRTLTANHGELNKVLKLFGELRRGEEVVSYYAKNLYQCFGTVQPQPVTIGGETASYGGRYLPKLSPTGLKAILTGPTGLTKDLQALRDTSLDKLNTLFKENRAETTAERAFLDQMALSQTQIRDLIDKVAEELQSIKGDDAQNQVIAAALLVKMNVTPVVTIHLPFSGDNHTDALWKNETTNTVSSVANIKLLMEKLKAYNLQDKVTFATMNVFGRDFHTILGRGHNASHSVSVMIGKGIKPGVIGGLVPGGRSADIDSKTGLAGPAGDIPSAESLASVAKTLGRALGISATSIDDQITAGKIVQAALV
ncbi:MAG: DUF1501 domain-containing protein, partial [Byssovorax sp.]